MEKNGWKKYFGPKEFYQKTFRIAAPLALQNLLMSGQSLIDTLMVSWIGMVSAVGTAAQIDVLSGLISYGIIGGIGMFAAQFYGAKDEKNLKRCTGLSFALVVINAIFWILMSTFFGKDILGFYIKDAAVIEDAYRYLRIVKWSMLIGAVSYCFGNMYRSTQQPRIALRFSVFASVLNVLLNWILIFGAGPVPAMGIEGAALATVLAQTVSASLFVGYSIYSRQPFVGSFEEMFGFDLAFVKPILSRIWPLIVNESTFGFGQTLFIKAFGVLGKSQMDAYYVGNHIYEVMTFVIYGYGSSVQILLGTELGRGKIDNAKRECDYHIGLSGIISAVLVIFLAVFAKPLVGLFRLNDPAVEQLAVWIVYVFAIKSSMRLYNFMIFCVLRSGGDAKIIQFLDSGLEWSVGLPSAFISVWLGITNIAVVLLITQIEQLVRLVLGMKRVKTYKWAKDLTKTVQ